MDERARPATTADLAVLTDLAAVAVEELTPHRGGGVWRRQMARSLPPTDSLRAALDADDHQVIVGEIDAVPVGYAVVRADVLRDGGVLGVIEDLFTLEGARGVGVGEAMMNAVVEWCVEQGCFGVDAVALPGDRHTKNFFESFGLVARAITVHRSLAVDE